MLPSDHCKNHPKWVNLEQLWEYAETVGPEYVDEPKAPLRSDTDDLLQSHHTLLSSGAPCWRAGLFIWAYA